MLHSGEGTKTAAHPPSPPKIHTHIGSACAEKHLFSAPPFLQSLLPSFHLSNPPSHSLSLLLERQG